METPYENSAHRVPERTTPPPLPSVAHYNEWAETHRDLQREAHSRELRRLVTVLQAGAVVSVAAGALFHPSAGLVIFGGLLLGAGVVNLIRAAVRVWYR
jgi:hypothetical protein